MARVLCRRSLKKVTNSSFCNVREVRSLVLYISQRDLKTLERRRECNEVKTIAESSGTIDHLISYQANSSVVGLANPDSEFSDEDKDAGVVDFSSVFNVKTNRELVRALLVLKASSIDPFVTHSGQVSCFTYPINPVRRTPCP